MTKHTTALRLRSGTATKFGLDEVTSAVRNSQGLVVNAAAHLGCSRTTVYSYLDRWPELQSLLEEVREDCNDRVENAMYENALKPNGVTDRIFWLKNRARDRGWADSHRNENVNVSVDPQYIRFGDKIIEF